MARARSQANQPRQVLVVVCERAKRELRRYFLNPVYLYQYTDLGETLATPRGSISPNLSQP